MSKKRTDEDIVTQAGVEVVLGGVAYDIKPLVIRDSKQWRKKLTNIIGRLPGYAKVTTDDPEGFAEALNAIAIDMPEEVTDLFFEYAKDLNRDEIERVATDAELAAAFQEVMALAFPLSQVLPNVLNRMRR